MYFKSLAKVAVELIHPQTQREDFQMNNSKFKAKIVVSIKTIFKYLIMVNYSSVLGKQVFLYIHAGDLIESRKKSFKKRVLICLKTQGLLAIEISYFLIKF